METTHTSKVEDHIILNTFSEMYIDFFCAIYGGNTNFFSNEDHLFHCKLLLIMWSLKFGWFEIVIWTSSSKVIIILFDTYQKDYTEPHWAVT